MVTLRQLKHPDGQICSFSENQPQFLPGTFRSVNLARKVLFQTELSREVPKKFTEILLTT